MVNQKAAQSQRIVWLEGIRILAVVALLLYHAQLLFTGYAYTPEPTGLLDNLQRVISSVTQTNRGLLFQVLAIPGWFGFQFVDVFVLVSGFSLVLSLKNKPLRVGSFLKKRVLRILWPFWTVAWLSYPILWAIGTATNSYVPNPWHIFAGTTFPLLFDYSGQLLLRTSGPWWFVPLILSFTLIFPFLWQLLQRWGAFNLLLISTVLTVAYRVLAIYQLGGHPTYVMLDTPADWQPFVLFLSKLSTFVLGIVIGQAYCGGRGPVFWSTQKALLVGIPIYIVGFVCQFYRAGWVVVDLLLPIGLTLCCMVILRAISPREGSVNTQTAWVKPVLLWLGAHSYSYFLVHNFVVDRTIKLVVRDDPWLYTLLLPLVIVGTLVLAAVVDAVCPLIRSVVVGLLRDLDYVLTQTPALPKRNWSPNLGDRVLYRGKGSWRVLKVERLLDEQEVLLYQISDGERSLWVNQDDLQPSGNLSQKQEANTNSVFP